jgi:hypothetical protein
VEGPRGTAVGSFRFRPGLRIGRLLHPCIGLLHVTGTKAKMEITQCESY